MENLAKELQQKFLVGVKDETSGIQTKECAITHTATPLAITTRQAGFGCVQFLKAVNMTQRAEQLYANHTGLPLQYYRVSLALIEIKLYLTMRHVSVGLDEIDDIRRFQPSVRMINLCTSVTIMPEPIAQMVNSIGILKEGECTYVSVLPPDQYRCGEFISLPENLTLSNLRLTVESLANSQSNADMRLSFRRLNPIPCCIWNENSVLMNPDHVIPPHYGDDDLEEDIDSLLAHKEYVGAKYPKYINTGKIDWNNFASGKDILVCSDISTMKVSDMRPDQQDYNYSVDARVIGNCEDFKFIARMNDAEQIKGRKARITVVNFVFCAVNFVFCAARFKPIIRIRYHSIRKILCNTLYVLKYPYTALERM